MLGYPIIKNSRVQVFSDGSHCQFLDDRKAFIIWNADMEIIAGFNTKFFKSKLYNRFKVNQKGGAK